MSKSAKPAAPAPVASSEVPFEEALRQLETVVAAMESDELPLEALLARYEEGVKLLEICQAKLAAAEVKISQLEQSASGDPVLAPLSPPADAAAD